MRGIPRNSPVEMVPSSGLAFLPPLFHKVVRLTLILASTSSIRRQDARCRRRRATRRKGRKWTRKSLSLDSSDSARIAEELVGRQAVSIPGAWVIGSDSVVSVEGGCSDKPAIGRRRPSICASSPARRWSDQRCRARPRWGARLEACRDGDACRCGHCRSLYQTYLEAEWPEVGYTVGVFRLEGRGVQLFDASTAIISQSSACRCPAARRASRTRAFCRMIRIALTGSIGMGKSTVAAMFEGAGVPVFDADAVVRRAAGPGGALVETSATFPGRSRWGARSRLLARARARGSAPSSRRSRRSFIRRYGKRAKRSSTAIADAPALLFEIPLLFETGGEKEFDKVIVVSAPAQVQRARVLARPG